MKPKKKRLRVSIIIPAYNEEERIEACLKSIQKQTEKPDEIIVVDNNSTDNTAKLAKKLGARVVVEKRQGAIYAAHRGLDEAQYELIARTDADCILPPNWVKIIKQTFLQKKIDALVGGTLYYDTRFPTFFITHLYTKFMRSITEHYCLLGPNMIITKAMWKRIKKHVCKNDTKIFDDIDLSLHVFKEGGVIDYEKSIVVKMSSRRIKNNPESFFIDYPMRLIKMLRSHKLISNKEI